MGRNQASGSFSLDLNGFAEAVRDLLKPDLDALRAESRALRATVLSAALEEPDVAQALKEQLVDNPLLSWPAVESVAASLARNLTANGYVLISLAEHGVLGSEAAANAAVVTAAFTERQED